MKSVKFDFDLIDVDDAADKVLDKINLDNTLIGRGTLHFGLGEKGNFLEGIKDELLTDGDYIKDREDLIEDNAEEILDEPAKFKDEITRQKQKHVTSDSINIPQIKRELGKIQSFEEVKETRREIARGLTLDDVRYSKFIGGIKAGRFSSSFNDSYDLEPSEGEGIQRRLHEEYLEERRVEIAEERAVREAAKEIEKEMERERVAEEKAIEEAAEKAEKEAIEEAET